MGLTPEQRDDLLAKAKAATQGEWYSDSERSDGVYGSGEDTREGYKAYLICAEGTGSFSTNRVLFDSHNSTEAWIEEEWDEDSHQAWDETARRNAAFIVSACNAVPDLIAALDAAEARIAELEALLTDIRAQGEDIVAAIDQARAVRADD
jgi:hypothetical protein